MTKHNRLQKKQINKFISNQEKDLDKLQQHLYDVITLQGLNNAETAALLFSVQKRVLCGEQNKLMLENMNINDPVNQLGIDLTLEMQKLLVNEYARNIMSGGD